MNIKAAELWKTNEPFALYRQTEEKKIGYNNEPVYWCRDCGSLRIGNIDIDDGTVMVAYCCDCNSDNIKKGHIEEWVRVFG